MSDSAPDKFHSSANPETETVSLKQLHQELEGRGVRFAYSSLSQFLALGDIEQQLGAGGKGNRRAYPHWAADFLADFLPRFEAMKISKTHAPEVLRRALAQFQGSENGITAPAALSPEALKTEELSRLPAPPVTRADLLLVAEAIRDALAAHLEAVNARPDRVLTAEQAAGVLACSPRAVSRYVRPFAPRKWLESDVQDYLRSKKRKL